MKPVHYLIILSLGFYSCTESPKKPVEKKAEAKAQQEEKLNDLNLNFSDPIQVDSSAIIMYPLILKKEDDDLYSIKSGSRPTTYWNVAFYNSATQTHYLLDVGKKMIIYEFDEKAPYTLSSTKADKKIITTLKGFIYYLVRSKDYNKNGNIDLDDPKYLFISDKDGKNFRQISPDDMSVEKWDIIYGSNKVALTVIKDTNGDNKFNDKDVIVPMIYNLNTDSLATDVFKEDFKLTIKQSLSTNWSAK